MRMKSGYTTAKYCCKKHSGKPGLEWTNATKLKKLEKPHISGCVKDKSNKVTYIQPGDQGESPDWESVNLNKCLMEQINNDTEIMTENKESAKNTMYTGAVIGSIISVFVLIIVFIFAKFKVPMLLYHSFLDMLEEDQPLLIGITVITIIFISVLSYLFFVVYGGKGKKTIIRGSLELSNVKYKKNIQNTSNDPDMSNNDLITINHESLYKYKNSIGMDNEHQCTYIFSLQIYEKNKKYTNLQHIFHVGNDKSTDTQYPGVWFEPDRNILIIYMSYEPNGGDGANGMHIEIDNINYEEIYQFSIVIHNGKDQYVEVYVNAKLIISKLADKNRKFNAPPLSPKLVLGTDISSVHTIEGEISNLINYSGPLTHREIESHYLSIISTTDGYLRYMGNLLKYAIMYPKNILFGDDEDSDSDCSN